MRGRVHGRAVAGVDALNLQHSVLIMAVNRFLGLLYALSIGWVGVWMPCRVLASLWGFWSFAGFHDEFISLSFLIGLSLGELLRLGRSLLRGGAGQ